jgi:predicted TIM-barrel fold metal-dependent hydrolase
LELAAEWAWPVYVRTGTPPTALPLPLAELARRFPTVSFLMGRSGATDFWIDAAPALLRAKNLFADTAYAPWDTVLDALAGAPAIGTDRIIFCSDAPYALAGGELRRMMEWPLTDTARAQVLGGNAFRLFTIPGMRDQP